MALAAKPREVHTDAMTTATRRITKLVALVVAWYATRRRYRNWGARKEECELRLPCDDLVGEPVIQVTEATSIDAPPSVVWSSLLQTARWDQLAVGDGVRLVPEGWMGLRDGLWLTVEAIAPEQGIVLRAASPNMPKALWSLHLQPQWTDHTRLIARARIGLRHPGEVFAVELGRPAVALITRGVLLSIKRRVQRQIDDLTTSELSR